MDIIALRALKDDMSHNKFEKCQRYSGRDIDDKKAR